MIIDNWLEQINDNSLIGACFRYLQMLWFYKSWNLTEKLEMYGITRNELDWFSSYLKNRKQMVFFQQDWPTFKKCTAGFLWVQLLFSLFINDVSKFTTEGCVLNMYACYVIIYTLAATSDELQIKFQLCVDNVHQWTTTWTD